MDDLRCFYHMFIRFILAFSYYYILYYIIHIL